MQAIAHSFAQLEPTFDMWVRSTAQALMRWALDYEYRTRKTRSGQEIHQRYDNHTVQELEFALSQLERQRPELAQAVRNTAEYKACVSYLCSNETRNGQIVRARSLLSFMDRVDRAA